MLNCLFVFEITIFTSSAAILARRGDLQFISIFIEFPFSQSRG